MQFPRKTDPHITKDHQVPGHFRDIAWSEAIGLAWAGTSALDWSLERFLDHIKNPSL